MNKILMFISLPALLGSWLFAIIGIYYLSSLLFGYEITEENASLAAMWAFVFSFGIVSLAGVLAAKGNYASSNIVRKIYLYSITLSAVLFFGHLVISSIIGLFEL